MTMTSYPFAGQLINDVQYSQLMSAIQSTGVVGNPLGTALLVSSDATGMAVQLQPGGAFLRGHYFNSTAVESLTIEPSDTASRIDRVVLRLDRGAKEILPAVLKGAPAASPSAPALTQTSTGVWEMLLADVPVPGGAVTIQPDGPQPKRSFTGSQVGVWTTETRPAGARAGAFGFNLSTEKMERYDGTGWANIIPVWGDIEGKPSTFPPSAHTHNELQHITGGSNWARLQYPDGSVFWGVSGAGAAYLSINGEAIWDLGPDGVLNRGTIPWARITGEPSTYAPSSHSYSSHSGTVPHDDVTGSDRAWSGSRTTSSWATVEVDSNGYFSKYTSTLRNKKNIRDLPISALEVVNASRPVIFDRTDGVTVDELGFIAEEMHQILPEATFADEDGQIEGIHEVELHAVTWKALQELSADNQALRKQLAGALDRLDKLDGGGQ